MLYYWYFMSKRKIIYYIQCFVDIDECMHYSGGCQGKCVNTAGSYTCICPVGEELGEDGRICVSKSIAIDWKTCHACRHWNWDENKDEIKVIGNENQSILNTHAAVANEKKTYSEINESIRRDVLCNTMVHDRPIEADSKL